MNSKLSKLRSKSPANRSAESSFSVAPSRRTPLSWMSSGSRADRLLVRPGVPNPVAGVAARSSATVYVSFASVIVALAFSAMLPSATAAASGPRLRPALNWLSATVPPSSSLVTFRKKRSVVASRRTPIV